MLSAAEIRDKMERVEKIKPIDEVNGVKVVTFDEMRDAAIVENLNNEVTLGTIEFNPDGTVARTPTKYAAVNPDVYFLNRYKKVKETMYVVTDYRAITDIPHGTIYQKQVPAHVIKRDQDGKLFREKVVNISDNEFIADFTQTLDREAMEEILPLCTYKEATKDSLPI